MEIAVYVRVSTKRQQQTQTIDQQIARLQAPVAAQPGWHLATEHIYRDDGYSGARLTRPGLDRLRDRAALAAFEGVLVTAPDRLARTYVHQVLLLDELAHLRCPVTFLDRPMGDDPHDQLVLQIRGAGAEYERTLIADRMRRGRQAKLRGGLLLPWTRAPYGYVLDAARPRDPSRVGIDTVKATVVAQIFAWYTDPHEALTLYGIARRLSDDRIPTPTGQPRWNVATIRGMLRCPAYAGTAYSGRTRPAPARERQSALRPVGPGHSHQPTPPEEWIAVPVPAIVSQEAFDAAQAPLERNVRMARRNNTAQEYLLRGLVSCGGGQLSCTGRSRQPGYAYYVCRGRTDALRRVRGQRCTTRFAPAHALDDLVWADLCRVLADPALLTHNVTRIQQGAWLPQALQAREQAVRTALAQLERQQERLLEAYLAEIIGRDEFARKRQEVLHTLNGLAQQRRQLEAQAHQQQNVATLARGITDFCQRVQPTLTHLTFDQRRHLVELLIDCVIVTDEQVEIRYVVPTGPAGEQTPFCHLRLDYFNTPAAGIPLQAGQRVRSGAQGHGGQQQPVQGLRVEGRGRLGGPDRPDRHLGQVLGGAGLGRAQHHTLPLHVQGRGACRVLPLAWDRQADGGGHQAGHQRRPQALLLRLRQAAILRRPHQQVDPWLALQQEQVVHVGLGVAHADEVGARTRLLGRVHRRSPRCRTVLSMPRPVVAGCAVQSSSVVSCTAKTRSTASTRASVART